MGKKDVCKSTHWEEPPGRKKAPAAGRGTFVLNVLWPWTLMQDVPRAYLGRTTGPTHLLSLPLLLYPFEQSQNLLNHLPVFQADGQEDGFHRPGTSHVNPALVCILARSKRRSNASWSSLLKARRNGFHLSHSDSNRGSNSLVPIHPLAIDSSA